MTIRLFLTLSLLLPLHSFGQVQTDLSTPAALMQYSSLDDANALGPQGLRFGSGTTIQSENEPESKNVYKLFLNKGLIWPLSAGLAFSSLENSALRAIGGHLKYSFFQRFRWPSLAASVHHSKLLGEDSQAYGSNYGVNGHLSWGFRMITLSIKWTAERQYFQRAGSKSLSLLDHQDVDTIILDRLHFTQSYGVNLQIVPHFVVLALEQTNTGNNKDTFNQIALKVGI